MSAFVVSRPHIHQLVTALNHYVAATEDANALGQMLWDENMSSVLYRYDGCTRDDMPGPMGETFVYTYVTPQRSLSALEVYKAVRCYVYQSCEHPAWQTSVAAHLMEQLTAALERHLGMAYDAITRLPAYDGADWEIRDDTPRQPPAPPTPVRHISLLDTAKLVRKALKATWPTVKFSVRCDRYAGGCSIDVTWTDGPTDSEVSTLCRQFNGKHFDGMTDMASAITQEYAGECVRFGADYVQTQRSISTAFMRRIAAQVAQQYKVEAPEVYNSGAKYGTGDQGCVVASPAANVRIPDAPPFWRDERLMDVIYHVAHQTSALSKPRIRRTAIARQIA